MALTPNERDRLDHYRACLQAAFLRKLEELGVEWPEFGLKFQAGSFEIWDKNGQVQLGDLRGNYPNELKPMEGHRLYYSGGEAADAIVRSLDNSPIVP